MRPTTFSSINTMDGKRRKLNHLDTAQINTNQEEWHTSDKPTDVPLVEAMVVDAYQVNEQDETQKCTKGAFLISSGSAEVTSPNDNDASIVQAQRGTEVCFGGLYNIPVEVCDNNVIVDDSQTLCWDGTVILKDSLTTLGRFKLSKRGYSVLQTLSGRGSTTFEISARCSRQSDRILQKCGRNTWETSFIISVNLYGPISFAQSVGVFLQNCGMYLQIPEKCGRNVPYINPHCIGTVDKNPVMTSIFDDMVAEEPGQEEYEESEVFAEFGSEEKFEEERQPDLVNTPLLSHQKQALTFMLGRERGWDLTGSRPDVWRSYTDRFGRPRYQNGISGATQPDAPKEFRGGILADDMGLGKTVSMLALIVSGSVINGCCCIDDVGRTSLPLTKGTLIIVPLSLLTVWEWQIKEHMASGLPTLVYYGPNRYKHLSGLERHDIVITTYNVVASEWKNRKGSSAEKHANGLLGLIWHRIVLDEAHMIRDRKTLNARAVYALHGIHRWCITGTPLQNRVGDISGLLRFLRVYPYDEPKTFEAEIIQPWKSGINERPIHRLRSLMKMIALHRSRMVITLPPRHEEVKKVAFNAEELRVYEMARESTVRILEEALSSGPATGSVYLNAFQRINNLRYICNHGVQHHRNSSKDSESSAEEDDKRLIIEGLDHLLDNSDQACLTCGTDIEDEREGSWQNVEVFRNEPLRQCTSCLRERTEVVVKQLPSLHSPQYNTKKNDQLGTDLPSKIKAILAHLSHVSIEDKCVIFSFWTTTLDIMQQGLEAESISHCRYDGRLKYANRAKTLARFQNDSSIRVLLVSITCGGQGLDLTAANHAILIEPQWNPMLEEQAISRIYRISQIKGVSIVRFVMKDTFEQIIVQKQERKRILADLVLGRSKLKEGDAGRKQLLHLRELLC